MSGTTVDRENELRSRIKEYGERIRAAHQEAQEAGVAFDSARDECHAAGEEALTNTEHPLHQKAAAASRARSEAAQREADLQQRQQAMLDLLGPATPGTNGNGPTDGPAGFTVGDTLLKSIREQAGSLALRSESYQQLKARGAFHQVGRKSIDATLLERHSTRDPETGENINLSREALVHAIQSGNLDRFATLVTGTEVAGGAAGNLVVPDRLPGITVPLRTRALRLVDLITVGRTDSDEVSYAKFIAFTNAAAETAEATATTGTSGTKPESAVDFAPDSTTVKTFAHWIAATKKALADAGQLRTLLEGVLRLGLDLRLDQQLATGSGVGENFRGIYNTPGIQNYARVRPGTTGTATPESELDAMMRAITLTRLAFFEPTAIGINPVDLDLIARIRTGRAATANSGTAAGTIAEGEYLMADPTAANGGMTIWGLRPVVSPAFTAGVPIVGDFKQMVMWLREGTQVSASDSHMDFFIRNMVAILAEFRAAVAVLAPAAFATVTF